MGAAGIITGITAITANDLPHPSAAVGTGADELAPADDPILSGPKPIAQHPRGHAAAFVHPVRLLQSSAEGTVGGGPGDDGGGSEGSASVGSAQGHEQCPKRIQILVARAATDGPLR